MPLGGATLASAIRGQPLVLDGEQKVVFMSHVYLSVYCCDKNCRDLPWLGREVN